MLVCVHVFVCNHLFVRVHVFVRLHVFVCNLLFVRVYVCVGCMCMCWLVHLRDLGRHCLACRAGGRP